MKAVEETRGASYRNAEGGGGWWEGFCVSLREIDTGSVVVVVVVGDRRP